MHIKILILSQEFAETAMNELLGWYGYEARGGQGPRGPLGARTGSPSPGAQPPTSASPNDDAGNCQTPFCPVIVQYGILRIPVFFPRRSISMQFLEYWFLFDQCFVRVIVLRILRGIFNGWVSFGCRFLILIFNIIILILRF